MNNQADDYSDFNPAAGDLRQQYQAVSTIEQPAVALTVEDVDALAREIDQLPRVEKFDAKAQLARLGPALDEMKKKGYDLAAIRDWLSARGVHASISSISRSINGGGVAKPKSKKPRAAK